MNERALLIGQGFRQVETDTGEPSTNTLHIYLDGVILALTGGADKHLDIRETLLKDFPGFEEAKVGDLSIFVVPMPDGVTVKPEDLPPHFVGPTTHYHDHRWQDACTLADVVEMQRKYLAISPGPDGQHRHGE